MEAYYQVITPLAEDPDGSNKTELLSLPESGQRLTKAMQEHDQVILIKSDGERNIWEVWYHKMDSGLWTIDHAKTVFSNN